MRRLPAALLALLAMVLPVQAEEPTNSSEPQEKVTYFLIDVSGTMKNRIRDAEVQVEERLERLQAESPDALVSITYFRADTEQDNLACAKPVGISDKVIASSIDIKRQPFSGDFKNDSSPLGAALEAAILNAEDRPADIFLVSDEDQTQNCGPDICAVADAYLPRQGITVSRISIGPKSADSDRLGCVNGAQSRPVSSHSNAQQADRPATNTPERPSVSWETAGFMEKWLLLIIFMIAVASAVLFAVRYGSKAHDYEHKSEHIQLRQRMILTEEGDVEQHKRDISELSKFSDPPKKRLRRWAYGCAVVSTLLLLVLLFCDGSFFFIPLDENDRIPWIVKLGPARKLAWMVLSSNFSNAFAILAITPILFAFAQNWRYTQAKRTFAFVSGAAAEEEAKRQTQEVSDLFQELLAVRSSIDKATITSQWAEPRPTLSYSRRRQEKYSPEDRYNLNVVKKKLRELAQGQTPSKVGETAATLGARIRNLKHFASKPGWGKNWELSEYIRELNLKGLLGESPNEWLSLAKSIEQSETAQIKRIVSSIVRSEGN